MSGECREIRSLLETQPSDRGWTKAVTEQLERHLASCSECRRMYGEIVCIADEFAVAQDETFKSDPVLAAALAERIRLGVAAGRPRGMNSKESPTRVTGRGGRRRDWRLVSAGILATAATAVILLILLPRILPSAPTGQITNQQWLVDGVVRSGQQPNGLALEVTGRARARWLSVVVVTKAGKIQAVRIGSAGALAVTVDGDYRVPAPPFRIDPQDPPVAAIFLFTIEALTSEDWRQRGPDAAPTETIDQIAERLKDLFGGETIVVPLAAPPAENGQP